MYQPAHHTSTLNTWSLTTFNISCLCAQVEEEPEEEPEEPAEEEEAEDEDEVPADDAEDVVSFCFF